MKWTGRARSWRDRRFGRSAVGRTSYDLAIAGAGPAGSTLALLAARAGYRVLLAERSHFDASRIGETTPPELRPLLSKLALSHLLNDTICIDAPAVVSVWGSNDPAERSHVLSPYGDALHLDRCAFDQALALAASTAGADLRLAISVRFERLRSNGYRVVLSDGTEVSANIAVRANGRAGGPLGLPGARCHLDRNIAVVARFAAAPNRTEVRTVIEAIAGGWFYLAAVPGNQIVAVFTTEVGGVPIERTRRLHWWLEALARTKLVRAALLGQPVPRSLSIYDARSSHLRTTAGADWFALGDARLAPDPLSGQGIIWAMEDAIFAARALKSGGDFAQAMEQRMSAQVTDYLAVRDQIYRMEQRFPDDAYWSPRLLADAAPNQPTIRSPCRNDSSRCSTPILISRSNVGT
jgi:flavin-dependent dehydrogenase